MLLLSFLNDRYSYIYILSLKHDLVMQNELVLIGNQTHRHTQLHWLASFTLCAPPGMLLKDGKDLLFLGNFLIFQQSAINLINELFRINPVKQQQTFNRLDRSFASPYFSSSSNSVWSKRAISSPHNSR